jgi:putative protease
MVDFVREKEPARTGQRTGIEAQLGKLGGTIYMARNIEVNFTDNWFIPSSVLADMRRTAVEEFHKIRKDKMVSRSLSPGEGTDRHRIPVRRVGENLTYLANVANHRAAEFYYACGVEEISPAYELEAPRRATLMFCRHCLRYAMGWCPHHGGKLSPYREPYTLVSADGKRFTLSFDCKRCVMLLGMSRH